MLALLTALPPLLFVPPTTKSDESYHWAYAVYLAKTGTLPPYLSPEDATSREAHQPPLYYYLAAVLSRRTANPDAIANQIKNPFFLGTERGNRNFDILGPDALRLFWIGRLLSLVFWLLVPLTVLWAWRPALGLRDSLTAAALVSLIPLLPFVGTSYSNDMPSVTFMAVALGALLRLLDPAKMPRWRWCLWLGLGLGLSMLSKLYALPLMGAIALIALMPGLAIEPKRRLQLLGALALTGIMLVPWMWNSYQRLGDPLGLSVFGQVMGQDPTWFRPDKVLQVGIQTWRTFWGDLGPGGIDAIPPVFAAGLGVIELAAIAGIVRRLQRAPQVKRHLPIALLLGLWVLLALASFAWTFLRAEVQVISGGRNLLYLHLVNAPLLVAGLQHWLKRMANSALFGAGLVLTLWSWVYLSACYPLPQTGILPPQPPTPIARFGDQYALLDWQARQVNDTIHVHFTLAKVSQDDEPRAYFLQLVAPSGELLANLNTYPAYGALSTAYLPQGTTLHEFYELRASQAIPPGTRLLLGLWAPPAAEERLPAYDAAGHALPDSAYSGPWSSPLK
ncbi:MAG: glycosyltransferase family 39 protein [Chloroflexi bacterium]|nr:glycosyltransferase family 39 protein [Chloroflexota bacterium]